MATILRVVFLQHNSKRYHYVTVTVGEVNAANTKSLSQDFLYLFPSATAHKNVAIVDGGVGLGVHLVYFLIYYGWIMTEPRRKATIRE